MREVRWERMFPDELERAFAERPVVYFTYGLCEPHGPQNAVGLDAIKAHGIACAVAREYGGIVAPADYWHIHELGGYAPWLEKNVGNIDRAWLTSVPPWVHFKNICYQLRAADVLGFRAGILLTGHYGPNWQDLKTLIDLVQPHVGVRLYGLPDFEANQPGFDQDGDSGGDHAGRVETSLLWALAPDCVDVSRIGAQEDADGRFAMGSDAGESSRLVGERMVADEVRWIAGKAATLLEAYERELPTHALRTFEDVERLWEDVVRPRLKDFLTMQQSWEGRDEVASESRWHANWKVPDRG